jgi:bile acid:Na+ symporter, BASS family
MTVQSVFNGIFNASLVVMLLTLVASLGMTFSIKQILQPLRRGWLLAGALVVNLGLVPLAAIGLGHLLPLTSHARIGFELAAFAAAGPAGLKCCELAKRADLAMGVAYVIVLNLANILVAPLWVKAIVTGAKVNPWSVVLDLLILVLIPLTVGLILRSRYPEHRLAWKAGLEKISNIALLALIAFGLAANWKAVVHSLGSWVLLASVLIIAIAFALGWAITFRNRQTAITVSLITSVRFTPIGLVVISTVLHNNGTYLTPALVYGVAATFVPLAVGAEIGRFLTRHDAKPGHTAPAPTATAAPPKAAATG